MLRPTCGTRDVADARHLGLPSRTTIAAAGIIKTFQNPQLFSELTVAQHVVIASHLRPQAVARNMAAADTTSSAALPKGDTA